jgi:hypothetical protein
MFRNSVRPIAALLATAGLALAQLPAHAAPTAQITGGYTLVEPSSTFTGALTTLQVQLSKVVPGAVYQVLYFPITAGRLDASNAKVEIGHAGGLTLTRGATTVNLTDFVIDTTGTTPRLTGLVTANGSIVGRIPLFNITLPSGLRTPLTLPAAPNIAVIEGSQLALTSDAATALNGAFGVTAFTVGLNIGVASIFANY